MGGMRFDPKKLPLRYQEQVAKEVVAQIAQNHPEVRVTGIRRNIQPVRRMNFVNARAATRYRILRKQAESGMICELLLHKNEQGLIDCFTYTITEEY